MSHECKKEDKIDLIYDTQRIMEKDIKKLLQFQASTNGKLAIISVLYSTIVIIASKILFNK